MEGCASFKFKKDQKIFQIGGVRVGGHPGELSTVLIGSLFQEGPRMAKDRNLGLLNKGEAERLIKSQEEMSDRTGVPFMLDVFGETVEILQRRISLVSELTDAPLLINGPKVSVRVKASDYAREIGLLDRAVYNSITYEDGEEDITAIGNIGIKAAIVQAFNPKNPWPEGMIQLLKGNSEEEGLLEKTLRAGLEKPLVLTPGLDIPSLGFAAKAVHLSKEEFGLPTGTAAVGVVGHWKKLEELGRYAEKVCSAGVAALAQSMGADFIIYGSVAKAGDLFPVCAMVDAITAYNARASGLKAVTKNHPLYKIF